MKCPQCGADMVPMIYSSFCPKDCGSEASKEATGQGLGVYLTPRLNLNITINRSGVTQEEKRIILSPGYKRDFWCESVGAQDPGLVEWKAIQGEARVTEHERMSSVRWVESVGDEDLILVPME